MLLLDQRRRGTRLGALDLLLGAVGTTLTRVALLVGGALASRSSRVRGPLAGSAFAAARRRCAPCASRLGRGGIVAVAAECRPLEGRSQLRPPRWSQGLFRSFSHRSSRSGPRRAGARQSGTGEVALGGAHAGRLLQLARGVCRRRPTARAAASRCGRAALVVGSRRSVASYWPSSRSTNLVSPAGCRRPSAWPRERDPPARRRADVAGPA